MTFATERSRRMFGIFSACVLAYNIPVILWGAYVRISFSGDGCGANWPTCNGQVVPQAMAVPTLIEYTHRLMTSLDTAAVLALVVWAFLAFPKLHPVRRYAVLGLVFLLVEALLGAGLVLFRYVAKDHSAGRVWYLSAHLTNTTLLLGALTLTAWAAITRKARFRLSDVPRPLIINSLLVIFVSVTGTIAALGDTLFPASSLASGIAQDFAASTDWLLRLRVLHPVIAVAAAIYILWTAAAVLRSAADGRTRRAAAAVIAVTILQLAVGMSNLALLAPLPMQIVHLTVADVVWIATVVLAAEAAGVTVRAPALYATAS